MKLERTDWKGAERPGAGTRKVDLVSWIRSARDEAGGLVQVRGR